jgi:uncharacterized protein (DUF433 family)
MKAGSDDSLILLVIAFLHLKASKHMTRWIVAQQAPLQVNADGVFLVGTTRVTLDTLVAVFNQGLSAEEIVYRYPSLKLADVYATIAFYLNHQQEVEAYLGQRQQQAQQVRQLNQTKFDSLLLRDRVRSHVSHS